MTREQFKAALEIERKIKEENDRKKLLEDLISRVYETTGETQNRIRIQLGEKWCCTPQAEVFFDSFIQYLKSEIELIEDLIDKYNKQYEEI